MPEHNQDHPPAFSQDWQPEPDQQPDEAYVARRAFRFPRINWPLLLGALTVGIVIIIAAIGPNLAPRDPLEENTIIRIGEEWKIPPFAAFTPGFLLGSDQFGRDLFSRLLWALRPTMTMVAVVAAVRLVLGVSVGLGAGWFTGGFGRALDALIGAALSVPVLMVALGAIAAVGIEVGIWAFVIGLSINGWVETARFVREQTRLVKGQLYVEAARALGASDAQVVLRHILRQIMPMVWMLFSFEISGTLMVTAALGFLGYYIGGDVWVLVTDNTARRISGTPELGQMLATTWVRTDEPWAMIAVGSVVFSAVLGFNLLGQGLRRRLSLKRMSKRTLPRRVQEALSTRVTEPTRKWMTTHVWSPLARQTRHRVFYPAVIVISILIVGSLIGWRLQTTRQTKNVGAQAHAIPGGLWSAERRDPQGTLWSQTSGPITPEIQWVFADPEGFAGGPAVSEHGTVVITSKQGTLYALGPDGQARWQVSLPAAGVGTPALGAEGQIYVTDKAGRLLAYSPQGDLKWQFQAEAEGAATSGPIVAPDGTIYYVFRGTTVQAVTPTGESLWSTQALQDPIFSPPRLSADGRWLFVKDAILDAQNGSLQEWVTPVDVDQYITGADGEQYLQSGNEIFQWRPAASEIETVRSATWDYRQFTIRVGGGPTDAGITSDQLVWLLYAGNNEDTRIVWLNMSGRTVGNSHYAQRGTRVIAVDRDGTTFACGRSVATGYTECMALKPGSDQPLWRLNLEQGTGLDQAALALVSSLSTSNPKINSGALVPGRLYVTKEEGLLFAIGEGQAPQIAEAEATDLPPPASTKPLGPDSDEIRWTFEDPTGFPSGPTVADDGRVYVASRGGTLYALDPDGHTMWQAALPAAAVGSPALSAGGDVYVADKEGNLSAFAPDGELRWRFEPPESKPPTVGPVVASDGRIYYNVGSNIQAVSPTGEGLWQTKFRTFRAHTPLQVSADGQLLFFADDVISTQDQALLEPASPLDVDRYFVGRDAQTYLRSQHTVMQWQLTGSAIEILQSAQWNYDGVVYSEGAPSEAGVTQEGVVWLLYTSPFGSTLIAWVGLDGEILGTVGDDFSDTHFIGVLEPDSVLYTCGFKDKDVSTTSAFPQCKAFAPGSDEPIWQVEIQDASQEITGGALAPGRLYVTIEEGVLYAIGEGQPLRVAAQETVPTTVPMTTLGPTAEQVAWKFEEPAGFASGPAVSDEGTVYIPSKTGTLYAIDSTGAVSWATELPAAAVGPPAPNVAGDLYVADREGNLSAFAPDGSLRWRFEPPQSIPSTVGPLVGPDGTIYYTIGSSVQAVSPDGAGLWNTRSRTFRARTPLQLDASRGLLFFADDIFDTQDGSLLDLESPVKVDQYIAGNDGQPYLRAEHTIVQWQQAGPKVEIVQSAQWDYASFVSGDGMVPFWSGVTREGVIWLMYTHTFVRTQIAWLDLEGQVLGTAEDPFTDSQVVGVLDQDATIYVCGMTRMNSATPLPQCKAFTPGAEEPVWQIELETGREIKGGALAPGRLFVATDEGVLYALGAAQQAASQPPDLPPAGPADIRGQEVSPPPAKIAWVFHDASGFGDAPAVSDNGTVYIASKEGILYALDAARNTLWTAQLPASPVGPPALSPLGIVYQADRQGNLSAYAPDGSLRWRFEPPQSTPSTVGPLVGPDGTIYYTIGSSVQAVSPDGAGLWNTRSRTFRARTPLQLDASRGLLFFADDIFDIQDGSLLDLESPVKVDQYIAGNDGQTYLRAEHTMVQWQQAGSKVEIAQSAQWDYASFVSGDGMVPFWSGVTREGVIWLMYTHTFVRTQIAWLDLEGQVLGTAEDPFTNSQVVGVIDQDATIYVCGMTRMNSATPLPQCKAFTPGAEEPVWQIELETSQEIKGGALAPGRLYVATDEGVLYALGAAQQAASQPPDLPGPADIRGQEIPPPPAKIAWVFHDASGFSDAPAVSDNGTVYIASKEGILYALDADRNTLWTTQLPASPVGPPALSPLGIVYQADRQGNLSAFGPDGSLRWRFEPPQSTPSTVGPLVGPDGTIYYTIGSSVQAVSPDGAGLWNTRSRTFRARTPLQLDASRGLLFYSDDIFETQDGSLLDLESPVNADQYVAGHDGQLYLRAQHTVMQWQLQESSVEILQSALWDYTGFVNANYVPESAGVTQEGAIWLSWYDGNRLAWLKSTGEVLGTVNSGLVAGQLITVLDKGATAYVCGVERPGTSQENPQCKAFVPGTEEPIWQVQLDASPDLGQLGELTGGVLVPGRLYVASDSGWLYAIGEGPTVPLAAAPETTGVTDTVQAAQPTPTAMPESQEAIPITPEVTPAPTALPPAPTVAGATLTYTIPIINYGPSDAPEVIITDTLPISVTFVQATSSHGPGCSESNGTVVCPLGDLVSGASALITIVVTVDPSAVGTLAHTTSVTSRASDPYSADNKFNRETVIKGEADLTISQIDAPDPVLAGRPLTYTLTITNNGPGDATGVTLTSTLPLSLTYVSAAGHPGLTCAVSDGAIVCNLGDLASGASAVIDVTVAVDPSARGTVSHSVTVAAREPERNLSDNTAIEETTINAEADLSITR